jgi:hypothetical protein
MRSVQRGALGIKSLQGEDNAIDLMHYFDINPPRHICLGR